MEGSILGMTQGIRRVAKTPGGRERELVASITVKLPPREPDDMKRY